MAKTKSGFYGQKENRVSTLKEWMNDNKRTEGYTFLNARYTKAFKRCDKELGKAGMLNYFMVAYLGINDCRAMMLSAKKQRGLIGAALTQMNQYRIEPETERIFKNNVTYFEKRIDHIMRITMENLRLTEYYPFFVSIGLQTIEAIPTGFDFDNGEFMEMIVEEAKAYNLEYPDEISEHMKSVQHEIEVRDAHRQRVKESIKAEKEAKRMATKARKQEVDEIEQNRKRHRARERRIERSFEHLYKI